MGRPLNKKYFGNRNVGSLSTTADNKIGGEGIASVSFSDAGSWMAVSGIPFTGLQLPAPSIPTGVQATWTINYGLYAVTTGAGKTGLILNETYTYPAYPGSIVRVSDITGTDALFTVVAEGSSTSLPTDTQGVNLVLRTGQGHTGVGTFLVDVFSHIVSSPIVEQGSGYTGDETITVTRANSSVGGIPAGTIVLTTDTLDASGNQYASQSGDANRDAYEENAIIAIDVSDDSIVDIIKQEGARRFKVQTATTTKFLNLAAPGDSTGLFIQATDSDGYDYWVKKISGHKATVVGYSGSGTPKFNNLAVHWSFAEPDASSVKIRNA